MDEPFDGKGFRESLLTDLRNGGDRLQTRVLEVLVDEAERDFLPGGVDGCALGQDVYALVGVVYDEPLQSAHPTFDLAEPEEYRACKRAIGPWLA